MRTARALGWIAAFGAAAWAIAAQAPATRRLTTVAALRQYPGYFHLQPVVVRGELAEAGERVVLRSDEHEMRVLLVDGQARVLDGPVEVRAQLIDVGRLEPGDPRLGPEGQRDRERWPRPGEELVLRALDIAPAPPQSAPTVRALALEPWRFADGQPVTVTGQFRGRNLFGDLPDAPKKSRYDFVLKVADAAIWVTGLRPRGRDFELNVDARVDTGRWVEVTGVVTHERGLVTIEGTRIAVTDPPAATPAEEPADILPPPPPVDVVFSSPSEGETDVSPTSPIRIQFSRSILPETLKGNLRIGYLRAESADRGEAEAPAIEVNTSYDPGTRALELTFSRPLERFRTVRIELREGVKAFDGAPVVPWTLTFSVGG